MPGNIFKKFFPRISPELADIIKKDPYRVWILNDLTVDRKIRLKTIRKKRRTSMSVSSLAKGISVGLTAGAVAYAVANATAKEKRSLKRSAGRALHAMGDIIEGIGELF